MIGNVRAAPHTEYCPQAVRDYVVTDRLVGNFDEALSLIRSALDGNTSKPPTCRVLRCRYIAFHDGAYTLVHGDAATRNTAGVRAAAHKPFLVARCDKNFLMARRRTRRFLKRVLDPG